MFDYQIVKKNSFAYAETGLGELWRESTLEEPLAVLSTIDQQEQQLQGDFVIKTNK